MRLLTDTNILVRISDLDSPLSSVCDIALQRLVARGDSPCFCAQNIIEFWSVATRPKFANGLELSVVRAEAELARRERVLVLLPEPADIAARWRALVNKHGITGRKAFDTRLVR